MRNSAPPILRNRLDVRSLVFVFLSLALLVLPHLTRINPWITPVWIATTSFFCFAASIVNHNHMHVQVFVVDWLNNFLNLALTLARGHTASGIMIPHNLNHHVETNTNADWIRPQLAGYGFGWIRMARYVVIASINMGVQRIREGAPRLERHAQKRALTEKLVIVCAVVAACWHDWQVFLLLNAVPWLLGLAMLVGVNLLQHDGCDDRSPLSGSRNFTSPIGNWLLFNNGFHTAHHIDPNLHWSALPALHASTRSEMPRSDLEVRSILRYLWDFGWHRTEKPDVRRLSI